MNGCASNQDVAIRLKNLTKFYGSHRGIEDLDIEVASGIVFGFLGPNGSGKTTTIRLIIGHIRPDKGEIEVLGKTQPELIKASIGYLPGEFEFYGCLKVSILLNYFLRLRGIEKREKMLELAERFNLDLRRRVEELSKGNKQKVGLVQAFMHDPELLILDEPTTALDPLMQEEFYRLLRETVQRGRTVFMSSHNIHEVDRVCEAAAIMREGKLIASGPLDQLRKSREKRIELRVLERLVAADLLVPGVSGINIENHHRAIIQVIGPIDPILKAISRYTVQEFTCQEASLEESFLDLYESNAQRD